MPTRHLLPVTPRLTTAAILASGIAVPTLLGAQRARISVEPYIAGIPGVPLWRRTDAEIVQPPFGDNGDSAIVTRSTRVGRGTTTLFGGRVMLATLDDRWRLSLDAGVGYAPTNVEIRDRRAPLGSSPAEVMRVTSRERQAARFVQLGMGVVRTLRREGTAYDVGIGGIVQQLRARTEVYGVLPGDDVMIQIPQHRTFLDPGVQLSGSAGPAEGRLAGLRFSMRSTHVWRSGGLANFYGADKPTWDGEHPNPGLRVKGGRWQWQPEVGLGWQVGF